MDRKKGNAVFGVFGISLLCAKNSTATYKFAMSAGMMRHVPSSIKGKEV